MLKLNNVSASYGGPLVLKDVSIDIGKGEIVAIVGPNGAGKTTLFRTISGLLKPVSGNITFDGTELTGLKPYEISRLGIAHVPEGRKIFPSLTVLENLQMGAYNPAARKVVEESLKEVFDLFPRLKERIKQKAGTLSGGERQMLAIARGLMSKPKLLMLDEPSLGLAPRLVEEVFRKIIEIHEVYGISILLVEQRVTEALRMSDRGYVIEEGKIVMSGNVNDLLGNPHVKRAYLGL
jgi:branched-chain amino acid transport system ATP-binding protein